MTTTNLDLVTYNKGVDPDQSFEELRMDLSGPTDSNMTKIDDFMGSIPVLLALYTLEASGCITQFTNFTNDLYQPVWPLNGSFETAGSGGGDLFANWSENYGAGGSGSFIRMSGSGHTGTYGAYVTGSAASLSQYSSVFWSGSSYTFEFWSYGDGVNQAHPVVYDATSGSYVGSITYRTPISGSWNKNIISGSIATVPAGLHQVSTVLQGPDGTGTGRWVIYDDVRAYNASGSIGMASSALNVIENKFKLLRTFSGASQADFTGISGAFTHIIILGTAAVNTTGEYANIGIDFNGDSASSNYSSLQWTNAGSAGVYTESITEGSGLSQISLGRVNGDVDIMNNYGTVFMGIIPDYSGSGSLYRTAMGISILDILDVSRLAAGLNGGVWKSTSAINRIRVFGTSTTGSARANFYDGTKISIYGLV